MKTKPFEKPYIKMLKEDIAPYLTHEFSNPLHKNRTYFFKVPTEQALTFNTLITIYPCWKHLGGGVYTYDTSSSTMANLYKDFLKNKTIDKIADIPIQISDVFRWGGNVSGRGNSTRTKLNKGRGLSYQGSPNKLEFSQGYYVGFDKTDFNNKVIPDGELVNVNWDFNNNTNKEKKMSGKFRLINQMVISIGDRIHTLADPVDPNKALVVVLALNDRVKYLIDQLTSIHGLEGKDVKVSNITETLSNEIDEIKETINYINENLDT